jgi:hypothetical protein
MSDEQVDKMLDLMEKRSRGHNVETEINLEFQVRALALRERQVKTLEELVVEIRRLRVTGIQP